MLIALIIAMLAGGAGESIFLVPDIENRIKKVVQDKTRKKEILAIFDQAQKDRKTLNKDLQAHVKKFKSAQQDRSTSRDTLITILSSSLELRKQFQEQFITYGLEVRGKLTDEEFAQIFEGFSDPVKKESRQDTKNQLKVGEAVERMINQVEDVVIETVEDQKSQNELVEAISEFETGLLELSDKLSRQFYRNHAPLKNREIERGQLEEMFMMLDETRVSLYLDFIDLRFSIIEHTTEDEWEEISKKLQKIYG